MSAAGIPAGEKPHTSIHSAYSSAPRAARQACCLPRSKPATATCANRWRHAVSGHSPSRPPQSTQESIYRIGKPNEQRPFKPNKKAHLVQSLRRLQREDELFFLIPTHNLDDVRWMDCV
jgi:hypothetical protein